MPALPSLPDIGLFVLVAISLVAVLLAALKVARARVKVTTSVVAEKYGKGEANYISGKSTVVWPYFEAIRFLPSWLLTIVEPGDQLLDIDKVDVILDWSWQGKIVTSVQDGQGNITPAIEFMRKAFENFGNYSVSSLGGLQTDHKDEDSPAVQGLKEALKTTLKQAFRSVCGTMTIDEINNNRETFAERVQSVVNDELRRMGVETISMGIADIKDPENYLKNRARTKLAGVKRDAEVAEAKANQEARQAEIDAQTQILQQQEALEMRRVAKEEKVGLAEAEKERKVQEQLALAVQQRKQAEEIIPAEATAKAVKIKADAEKVKTTVDAEAAATARTTKANAEATALKAEAGAQAEAVRVKGQAEADATEARGFAEAAAKEKLAAAVAAEGRVNLDLLKIEKEYQMRQAVGIEMAQAMGQVGQNVKITQIGGGDGGGLSNLVLNMMQGFAVMQQGLNDVFGTSDIGAILKGGNDESVPASDSSDQTES